MTLQEAVELQGTLSFQERRRLVNETIVIGNILKGVYRTEAFPLDVAQEDLDILNGDKTL